MDYRQFSNVTNLGEKGYFPLEIDAVLGDPTTSNVNTMNLTRFIFLTSYSEDFAASWDLPERAFGRLNPDYRYGQTNRKVSIGFKLPARNVKEAIENLSFCEGLAKLTYGVYSVNDSTTVFDELRYRYEGANLNVTINFGSLLQNEKCFVNDFSMDMNLDAGVFEFSGNPIDTSDGASVGVFQTNEFNRGSAQLPETSYVYHAEKGKVFPKEINVTMNFTILHEYRLGFGGPERPGKPNYWAENRNRDWPHGAGPITDGLPLYMADNAIAEIAERVSQTQEAAEREREESILQARPILDSFNNIINDG